MSTNSSRRVIKCGRRSAESAEFSTTLTSALVRPMSLPTAEKVFELPSSRPGRGEWRVGSGEGEGEGESEGGGGEE